MGTVMAVKNSGRIEELVAERILRELQDPRKILALIYAVRLVIIPDEVVVAYLEHVREDPCCLGSVAVPEEFAERVRQKIGRESERFLPVDSVGRNLSRSGVFR